jgi:hypothetical protein
MRSTGAAAVNEYVEVMTTVSQRQHFTQARSNAGGVGGAKALKGPPSGTTASSMRVKYRIVEGDDSIERVCAVDDRDQVIVGAFRSTQENYWLLYITPLVAQAAGVAFRPGHVALWSREQARQWVDLLGHLYCNATQFSGPA